MSSSPPLSPFPLQLLFFDTCSGPPSPPLKRLMQAVCPLVYDVPYFRLQPFSFAHLPFFSPFPCCSVSKPSFFDCDFLDYVSSPDKDGVTLCFYHLVKRLLSSPLFWLSLFPRSCEVHTIPPLIWEVSNFPCLCNFFFFFIRSRFFLS